MNTVDEINCLVKRASPDFLDRLKNLVTSPLSINRAFFPVFRKKFDPHSDRRLDKAYDFYNDIWPEIRKRQLGVDKLPDEEQKALDELHNVPVSLLENGGNTKGLQGMYSRFWHDPLMLLQGLTEKIYLDPKDKDMDRNFVHELRHYLARRMKDDESTIDRLNKTYGFKGTNDIYYGLWPSMANEEMYTTNAEHQFRIYKSLYDKLGRKPTAKDYFDHLKNYNDEKLYADERLEPVGYDEWVYPKYLEDPNERNWDASQLRKALMEKMDKAGIPENFEYSAGQKLPSWFDMLPDDAKSLMKGVKPGKRLKMVPRLDIESKAIRDWRDKWMERAREFKDDMMSVAKNSKPSNGGAASGRSVA